MSSISFDSLLERFVELGAVALVTVLVTGSLCCLAMVILTPLEWRHCTITREGSDGIGYYVITGIVDWGVDREVGRALTIPEARELAAANGCPIRKADK